MRLLVTRPEPDAARTAAALAALGHRPLVAPLLGFEALPPPEHVAPPAAILLTSANAARAIALWPERALSRQLPVFAVGDHTAAAARAAGFADVRSAEGDGAALAALVRATLAQGAGPLFYATADVPARDLRALLAPFGFAVTQAAVYRMAPAVAPAEAAALALAQGAVDGVLLYSRRTATLFAALAAPLRPRLAALPLYCLSAEVASVLAFGRVAIAAAPNEAALFALLPPGTETPGNH